MIVCLCHRVSDRDIAQAVRQGCASFEQLQDELRVASGCGACGECARETFDAQHAQAGRPLACRPLACGLHPQPLGLAA